MAMTVLESTKSLILEKRKIQLDVGGGGEKEDNIIS